MTRTFEYQPHEGRSITVPFSHIKEHFKFLACSEDGHDAIEAAYRRHNLVSSDFKIALEFDDIVVRTFRLFISVYEAGVETLYCDEANARVIKNIGVNSLSLVPNGFGARFEAQEWENNLRDKQIVIGADFSTQEDESAFALIGRDGAKSIDMLVMGQWENNHDEVACRALKEYDEEAEAAELKHGRAFGYARLMREKALKYGTTIEEMKKHWRCHIKFRE